MVKRMILLAVLLLQAGLFLSAPAVADEAPPPNCFPCAM